MNSGVRGVGLVYRSNRSEKFLFSRRGRSVLAFSRSLPADLNCGWVSAAGVRAIYLLLLVLISPIRWLDPVQVAKANAQQLCRAGQNCGTSGMGGAGNGKLTVSREA